MAEWIPRVERGFTLSESVISAIVLRAQKTGEREFLMEIPLQSGKLTAWCYQGESAREQAEAAWSAVSVHKDFVSNVKQISPDLFAFVG